MPSDSVFYKQQYLNIIHLFKYYGYFIHPQNRLNNVRSHHKSTGFGQLKPAKGGK